MTFAQVNRGWSDWPTPYADAQRTSWLRTDPKISVDSLSAPGFELQWTSKLANQTRGLAGLTQGVTASGVTLFVPASLVAGSSNNLYLVDNDTGYVVWSRTFEGTLPAVTAGCSGGIASAPTRIVAAAAAPTPVPGAPAAAPAGRGNQQGYRSLLGEPGQGIPVEAGGGRPGRAAGRPAPAPATPAGEAGFARAGAPAGGGVVAAPAAPGAAQPGGVGQGGSSRGRGAGIPGAPNVGGGGLGSSMVGYVISGDGQLHVVGLQSGKDLQRPAPFVPANSHWTNAVAVGTMMYTATSGSCGGAPNGVFAIDLDATTKPVVSYRTNGGSVVGPVAFSSDGNTLLAAIGAGPVTDDGRANAIVALDPKTLQLKDWFTQPTAEFVTGPTVFRQGTRDVVAAATKDGRVILLDVASLGGANHATPLAASRPLVATGGSISAEALSTWARITAAVGAVPASETRWVLVPLSGRPAGTPATNGAIRSGAVVALRVAETNGVLSLEPAWTSHDLTTAATPIIANGVVFALSSGRPAAPGGTGAPSVLHAYDGVTGKGLWNSAQAMTTFSSPGSFWSALSQVYVGANDGTVHAFGFLDERR
ncbi:MAG: hypothetical protein EXS38_08215 [Opitutus sp.]|nr:hypothetical protein [Opitutus sp.]